MWLSPPEDDDDEHDDDDEDCRQQQATRIALANRASQPTQHWWRSKLVLLLVLMLIRLGILAEGILVSGLVGRSMATVSRVATAKGDDRLVMDDDDSATPRSIDRR